MSFSKIEICNGALALCGETSITSLSQEGKPARVLARNYDIVRKKTLTRYRWNFAKKRVELAADPSAPPFGFTYKYQVPNDLIQLIGLYDRQEPQRNYTSADEPYKREGPYILSDVTPLKIFYIADITDTSQYDPSFATVFEYALAIKIYYDLTKGTDRYESLKRDMAQAVREARFANAIENTPEVITASDWIDSRFQDNYPYRIGPVL